MSILAHRHRSSRLSLPALETALCLTVLALTPSISHGQDLNHPILRIDPGGHTSRVQGIVFTADGSRLVSVGWDKVIRIWTDAGSEGIWHQERTIRPPVGLGVTGRLLAVAASPNKPVLAVGGYDTPLGQGGPHSNGVWLFDLTNGQGKRLIPKDPGDNLGPVTSLAFSSSGRFLVTGSLDGKVRLWDLVSGESLPAHINQTSSILAVSCATDSEIAAICNRDGKITLWDLSKDRSKPLKCLVSPGRLVAWAPHRDLLAVGCENRRTYLCNPNTDTSLGELVQGDSVTCLAWSPNGQWLATGSGEHPERRDTRVYRWSLESGQPVPARPFTKHLVTILAIGFSPVRGLAASADGEGIIYIWDAATGAVRQRLAGVGANPSSVAWSPDGKPLIAWADSAAPAASTLSRPAMHVFDLAQGVPAVDSPNAESWNGAVTAMGGETLDFGPGHKELIVQAGDREDHLTPGDPNDHFFSYAFTPHGDIVAGSEFALSLYSRDNQNKEQVVKRFIGHEGPVWDVAVSGDGRFLASASGDQTVRIWRLDDPRTEVQPLLSIFRSRDARWVAWTPEGYYNASPIGDQLLGWQVNEGPDQPASFYEAYRFRDIYYRPDIMERLLNAGSVEEAKRQADSERGPAPGGPTPAIEILSPSPGSTVTSPLVQVHALITDPEGRKQIPGTLTVTNIAQPGARGIELSAKGIEISAKGITLSAKELSVGDWTRDTTLAPGLNIITVEAASSAGQKVQRTFSVYFRHDIIKPTLYVLAIGVSKYRQAPVLKYAAKDAADMAGVLRGQKGKLFTDVITHVITDKDATRDNILAELKWLSAQAQKDDWTILFLSGHGVGDTQVKPERYYYAPFDFDKTSSASAANTGVRWSDLSDAMAGLPGTRMLILDTCRAGLAPLNATTVNSYSSAVRLGPEKGLITLASCIPSENSIEGPGENGAFTQALVEALTFDDSGVSPADANGDGVVTLAEADAYIANRVGELTQHLQHPSVDKSTATSSATPLAHS